MKCSDLHNNLALYVDGLITDADADAVKAHLNTCPLCRERHAEFRDMRSTLRQMRRPEISAALKNSIKQNVRPEARSSKSAWPPFSPAMRELLMLRIMPYGVGVCASVLVAVTFLTMMFSGMLKPGNAPASSGGSSSVLLASNSNPYKPSGFAEISPSEYAQTRLGWGGESPSINPQGALIALTKSLIHGGMKDDEVVVVADVFSNGLAQIAEVVEPSHNWRAVGELEKALDSDPSVAPFLPSSMENRPDSVRVVLKFQSVDVNTNQKRRSRHN